AGIARRRFDRAVEIELVRGALAGELAQSPERDLDVAGTEFDLVVVIPVRALFPHLDGAALPPFVLPNPDAFRIEAVGAERRRARSADPLVAALVALLLLGE